MTSRRKSRGADRQDKDERPSAGDAEGYRSKLEEFRKQLQEI
jgi:hypothetical protein